MGDSGEYATDGGHKVGAEHNIPFLYSTGHGALKSQVQIIASPTVLDISSREPGSFVAMGKRSPRQQRRENEITDSSPNTPPFWVERRLLPQPTVASASALYANQPGAAGGGGGDCGGRRSKAPHRHHHHH